MNMILYKTIGYIVLALIIIGIAIPKLTVHDSVTLTDTEKSCVQTGVKQQLDNPFQRIALALGKSAVVERQGDGIIKPNTMIVESYTIFRIPLPVTRLFNKFTQHVICDWAVTEYNSDQLGISFTYPSSYVLSEGNGEGSAADAYFIGLTPRPAPEPELPPGIQIDPEPNLGIYFGFYRNHNHTETPEAWIHDQMTYRAGEGNFQDSTLRSITVGGVPAVRYLDASGIYARDTVLLRHGSWMVQIAADDATYFKTDLDSILSSITFH